MLERFNSTFLSAITLAALFWLAYNSYQRDHASAIAYPDSSIERINEMAATPALKLTKKQAEGLNNVWQSYTMDELNFTAPLNWR